MKINKHHANYPTLLAVYMNTKEGKAFMLEVASQLIDGFEVDHKNRITGVVLDDTQSIKLPME